MTNDVLTTNDMIMTSPERDFGGHLSCHKDVLKSAKLLRLSGKVFMKLPIRSKLFQRDGNSGSDLNLPD